jgi:polyphosphate:AMP phosphotransferase
MARSSAANRLSKKDYEARVAVLRERLVQLQVKLKGAPFKILFIVAGVEGAGCGDLVNTLGSWLDPRGVETFAFRDPSDEERERPFLWRFWRSLPINGRIGVYAGSWYTETLRDEVSTRLPAARLAPELDRIRHFEKLHADDGTLIIKVWLHLTKAAQGRRLRALEADDGTAWRVTPEDWRHHHHYERLARLADTIRRATHRPCAPWTKVDAEDPRARNLAVAELILKNFHAHHRRLAKPTPGAAASAAAKLSLRPAGLKRLRALPLDQELSGIEYEAKREKWLGKLHQAVRTASVAKRSIVFAFEGWDAAGKGGAIRRLTSAIDVRDYRVIPIAKPTDEEKAHHYLWRFWRQLPRAGLVSIFDRSWYGRVLVERLEGFAREAEWRRAYEEINDFESQLVEQGTIVIKFWLQISHEEQLRRFRAREETAYKRHKIGPEDWRNRRKWAAYEIAVGDMLALTDTAHAPWQLIPANNKRHARLQILKTACKQIELALQR